MKKVLFIQTVMKQYRVAFFNSLRLIAEREQIDIKVVYSIPSLLDEKKSDNASLSSEFSEIVRISRFLGGRADYQWCLSDVFKSDLVVVEQANRHLLNYLLLVLSKCGINKVAFWGHGKNHQSEEKKIGEKFKVFLLKMPDWWFSYTEDTQKYIASKGYPENRITNVQNCIDIERFREKVDAMKSTGKQNQFREIYGMPKNAKLGIFCGSMYKEKCINFLLKSLIEIKNKNKNFYFIFIGEGPDSDIVKKFCNSSNWCQFLGPAFDSQKALVFASADFILNPGLVGLGVLDGFAAGLPMVTTAYEKHSPEVSYINNRVNGLIVGCDQNSYIKEVNAVLNDDSLLLSLKKQAYRSSFDYSMESMSERFLYGIKQALV